MRSQYEPVSEADRPAFQAQAYCNTALLLASAVLLATIAAKDEDGGGEGFAQPTLGSAVPGMSPLAFSDAGEDGDWAGLSGGDDDDAPMPLWLHEPTGRVWADVGDVLETDLLMVEQVTQGVGVRGLWDAGSVITQRLVNLRRVGPKVLLVAKETAHRASDPAVQSSVEQSFANSVMWSFAAQEDDGDLYIDLTDWALRDSEGSGLIGSLRRFGGGDFAVDKARSIVNRAKTKSRPMFSCVESNLTYTDPSLPGAARAALGRSLADPSSITVALRRSFVQLPPLEGPTAFTPRPFLPKSGYGQIAFTDEAAPLTDERIQVYIRRHAIGGVTPGRPTQAGGVGIKYYLDKGTPNYISGAILEGSAYPSITFSFLCAPQVSDQPAAVLQSIGGMKHSSRPASRQAHFTRSSSLRTWTSSTSTAPSTPCSGCIAITDRGASARPCTTRGQGRSSRGMCGSAPCAGGRTLSSGPHNKLPLRICVLKLLTQGRCVQARSDSAVPARGARLGTGGGAL